MLIGITGNIGSGKSTVAKYLACMIQKPYYDLDVMAKVIIHRSPTEVGKICERYGLDDSQTIDEFLKTHYFQNPNLRNDVIEFIIAEYKDMGIRDGIIESALLFEYELDSECDYIILVTADPLTRLKRLRDYRKMSNEDIENRISKQIPEKELVDRSDLVVDNTGDVYYIMDQLKKVF